MNDWIPIIASVLTLVGVIYTSSNSVRKIEQKLEISQAVTDTKIDSLTQEMRTIKEFATKVPVLEHRISECEDDIKDMKKGGTP